MVLVLFFLGKLEGAHKIGREAQNATLGRKISTSVGQWNSSEVQWSTDLVIKWEKVHAQPFLLYGLELSHVQ